MLRFALDTTDRHRFAWPEPLVIDCLREDYATRVSRQSATALAKLHAAALREMAEGEPGAASPRRDTLIAVTRRMGSAPQEVERLDRLVLNELLDLARHRFRTSPHVYRRFVLEITGALAPMPERAPERTVPVRFQLAAA